MGKRESVQKLEDHGATAFPHQKTENNLNNTYSLFTQHK